MKRLGLATIVVAGLAIVMSGTAVWRMRHLPSEPPVVPVSVPVSSVPMPSIGSPPVAGTLVAVPDTTNGNVYLAGAQLEISGLKFKAAGTPSATVEKFVVISQSPSPGTQVPVGTEVQLTVSSGPP